MVAVLVCIDVDDLERGIEFYTRGLGLALGHRHGADWVELTGAPAPLMLIACPAGSRACAAETRRYDRHWTPIHLDFVVDDLSAAVERARAAGATLERDIELRDRADLEREVVEGLGDAEPAVDARVVLRRHAGHAARLHERDQLSVAGVEEDVADPPALLHLHDVAADRLEAEDPLVEGSRGIEVERREPDVGERPARHRDA